MADKCSSIESVDEATIREMRKWNKDHPVREDSKEAVEKQVAAALEMTERIRRFATSDPDVAKRREAMGWGKRLKSGGK